MILEEHWSRTSLAYPIFATRRPISNIFQIVISWISNQMGRCEWGEATLRDTGVLVWLVLQRIWWRIVNLANVLEGKVSLVYNLVPWDLALSEVIKGTAQKVHSAFEPRICFISADPDVQAQVLFQLFASWGSQKEGTCIREALWISSCSICGFGWGSRMEATSEQCEICESTQTVAVIPSHAESYQYLRFIYVHII